LKLLESLGFCELSQKGESALASLRVAIFTVVRKQSVFQFFLPSVSAAP